MKKYIYSLFAISSIITSAQVGINTSNPTDALEINGGTAGDSGLTFTKINSSTTPQITIGQPLGVNAAGKVIVINKGESVIQFKSGNLVTDRTAYQDAVTIDNVPAGLWTVEIMVRYKAYLTNGDMKFQLGTDGTMSGVGFLMCANPNNGSQTGTAYETQEIDFHAFDLFSYDFAANGRNGASEWAFARVEGTLKVTTPGKLTLKVAKQDDDNSGKPTTIGEGTYIRITR